MTAVRIEVLNAQAGYYLPRGNDGDGKWRISPRGEPRDQLRGMIQTIGLLQYVLAPILMALSFVSYCVFKCTRAQVIAIFSGASGCVGIGLALYRGYLPALGW